MGPYLVPSGGGDGLQVLAGDAHHLLDVLQVDEAYPVLQKQKKGEGEISITMCVTPSLPQNHPSGVGGVSHHDAVDDAGLSCHLTVRVGATDLHLDAGGHSVTELCSIPEPGVWGLYPPREGAPGVLQL